MLDPRIRTLEAVIHAGSFSKAKDELFISAVSIMKQINALENDVGFDVLQRTNQGVKLTNSGKMYWEGVQDLMVQHEQLINRITAQTQQHIINIRMGTSPLRPAHEILEQYLPAELLKGVRFTLIPFYDDELSMDTLMSGKGATTFDCYIGPCDSSRLKTRNQVVELARVPLSVGIPRSHRLASMKSVPLQALHHETLVLVAPGESATVDRFRQELKLACPTVTLKSSHNFYGMKLVNRVAERDELLLSHVAWKHIHPNLIHRPLETDVAMPVGLIFAKEPSDVMKEFVTLLEVSKNSAG